MATLYGTQDIIDVGVDDPVAYPCFYFENSDFFNYRNVLSGAVIQTGTQIRLCVNNLHARAEPFRKSVLTSRLGDAVYDPDMLESSGKAYCVDSDVDRSKPNEVLNCIREKYQNEHLQNTNFSQHTASARVPNE